MYNSLELSTFLSFFIKPVLRPNLQPHRHQAQNQIANSRHHANPVQWPPDDPRIVPHFACPQNNPHDCQGDAGKQPNHKGAVPIVEAVDGKGRPAPQQTSTGAHGVGFQRQSRDHPGNEHGKDTQTVAKPLKNIPLVAASANAFLRQIDPPGFLSDSGNQAQQDCQKQGQQRADFSKQVHHLIRGHHPEHGFQPHTQRCKPQTNDQSINDAFQGNIIVDEVLSQHRYPEMVVGAVVQGEGQDQWKQTQVQNYRPLSAPFHTISFGFAKVTPPKYFSKRPLKQ